MDKNKLKYTVMDALAKLLLGKRDANYNDIKSKAMWVQLICNFMLGVLIICFIFYAFLSAQEYKQLEEKNYKLDNEVVQLEKNNNSLKEQKKALETKDEIERVARKELGLVKQGEVPYIK